MVAGDVFGNRKTTGLWACRIRARGALDWLVLGWDRVGGGFFGEAGGDFADFAQV